jgi:hypothetical protein
MVQAVAPSAFSQEMRRAQERQDLLQYMVERDQSLAKKVALQRSKVGYPLAAMEECFDFQVAQVRQDWVDPSSYEVPHRRWRVAVSH